MCIICFSLKERQMTLREAKNALTEKVITGKLDEHEKQLQEKLQDMYQDELGQIWRPM